MTNIGYCRFENTLRDLEDCYEHMDDNDLSESEKKDRIRLIELCGNIFQEYEDELDEFDE